MGDLIPPRDTCNDLPTCSASDLPDLPASKITSGTFDEERIPDMDADKIESGTFDVARIPDMDVDKITSGTFGVARIPDLPASKIDEGTFNVARIPDMDADKIDTGTFNVDRIPILSLDTSEITSGTFSGERIPDLSADKITSGTFDSERIPDIAGIGGTAAIIFVMDGVGAAIEAGEGCFLEMPFDATVKEWRLLAGTVGSIAVDVWMDTYSNFPPTDADSMPGAGNEPSISAANKAEETDLSAWTDTSLSKGDIIEFNIDSCGTIERCTLSMLIRKV